MPKVVVYQKDEILGYVSPRQGEQKLGETIQFAYEPKNLAASFQSSHTQFVLLGICEDFGVRANGGVGGAQTAWQAFLKAFLNIQSNSFLNGNEIFLLGHIDFSDWYAAPTSDDLDTLRKKVELIDDLVESQIKLIVDAGKIPIVIGGGHNNCYPIISACSKALTSSINAINLDAHADFRNKEGRHSGNGFRYAFEDSSLDFYAMLGLHEAYNNQTIIDAIQQNEKLMAVWFEDFFIRNNTSWEQAQAQCIHFVKNKKFGVELDLDSIQDVMSSAMTPVGISMQQALNYLYYCGQQQNSCYLHLPEAVAIRADGLSDSLTGKRLAYLVQAFIKGKSVLK